MDEERGSLLPPGRRAVEPAIRGLMGTAREQAPRKRWHERASTLLVAAVAAILALGAVARSLAAVARSSGAALARPPDALDETTRRTSEVGTAWRADGGVTTTLSAEDFLAFDSVQTWLAGLGVDWATLDDDARLESVAARTCSDASRRRRGCHAERPRRRVAATPRPPRGSYVDLPCGDESRRVRGDDYAAATCEHSVETGARLRYLPSKVEVFVDSAAIAKDVPGAEYGNVVISLGNNAAATDRTYVANLLVVIDYATGSLLQVVPTFDGKSYPTLETNQTCLAGRHTSRRLRDAGGGSRRRRGARRGHSEDGSRRRRGMDSPRTGRGDAAGRHVDRPSAQVLRPQVQGPGHAPRRGRREPDRGRRFL